MNNSLGRECPAGFRPFADASACHREERRLVPEKTPVSEPVFCSSLAEAFDRLEIRDGMTLSFHHHLRDGDKVLSLVVEEIARRGLKDLTFAPSSIFPCHESLVSLIKAGQVTGLVCNYMNGPVADAVSAGRLKNVAIMDTHGGRARAIESGDLVIDVAFLAMPAVDRQGNGTGRLGKNACGAIGYAIPDSMYARKVVLITDEIIDKIPDPEIPAERVDLVVRVASIGDAAGIVSGTTRITKDPVGLKIARDAATVLDRLGLLGDGFSMQTGAGGTSLAVVAFVRRIMEERNLRARFASGGITSQYVDMLECGRVDALMDVQCFDLEAVRSYRENDRHRAISAFCYGNPFHQPHPVVDDLDFVILGATEIDLDFNVNVTTDSLGRIIGGSGGHADTAHGAKVTLVTTNLVKARLPIIMEHVTTITTPGEDIDILVTERGIAVNPRRADLIQTLNRFHVPILPIADLMAIAHDMTGIPKRPHPDGRIVACVRYRDGTTIDVVRAITPR